MFQLGKLYSYCGDPTYNTWIQPNKIFAVPALIYHNGDKCWVSAIDDSSPKPEFKFELIEANATCIYVGGTNSVLMGAFLVYDKVVGIAYDKLNV